MRTNALLPIVILWVLALASHASLTTEHRDSSSQRVRIVAAENFYGNIAEQIGGKGVVVVSIMNNPNQDPHEFQPSAATAKDVADADIVIKNGVGYDSWIDKLIATKGNPNRIVITVADFVKKEPKQNPHLWYNPETTLLLADKLAQVLKTPSAAIAFHEEMKPLFEKMTFLKKQYPKLSVTATEPLFTPMANVLGWKVLHEGYQWAIMNETEPSFQQIVDYQESLKNRKVSLLFYNSQVANPSTVQLQGLAKKYHISVIGVTELQPSNAPTYQSWMLSQLNDVERVLAKQNHN
ncbi:MAG: zinc ABC transporter substrate-binding protein [Chthoniobacterales bacterium]|nr:zinc ABC transporter substrate-binding protein [Chthoniobacterales bacterium]